MIGRTNVVVVSLAVAWLCVLGTADAQLVTGTILGVVTDESRAVLPGVTATITSTTLLGGPQTVATDTQGSYRFPGLTPGTYTLTLALQGFGTYSEELRVLTGGTVERNVALKVGTMAESITVTGESPMVDTRSAAVASTTTREVIENLPIIRTTVTDYVQATPGVSASSPGAYNEQIQVMGSPSNETTYVHDGVVINHVRTGNTWQGADIDSVEEINTVALGASSEWQSTGGGVVNVVTKSGTNKYAGDATAYWKPNQLQSQSIKVNCNCPDGETGFNLGKMRDETIHFGGPILKDRLWFYTGFQHYAFTYAPPGTYPSEQPTSYWNRFPIKGTWQLTPTMKFSSLLHYEWWGGYSTGPTRSVALQAAQFYDTAHINSYGEELNKTFGNATMLTVRAGGWWEPNQSYTSVAGDLVSPSHTDNFTGLVSQGVPSINRVVMRRDAQSAKAERYISGRRSQHSVRFGLQFERAHAVSQTAFPSGVQYYDFNGAPDYALFSAPSVQSAAFNTQGVWAEDQVTVGNRITFTGGVRWDRMQGTSPDEQAVNNTLEETGETIAGLGDMFTWHVVSPRAGVNFKLTADGKTVLRATYGRAYRPILLNEIDVVHPGIADLTQRSYSAATGGYTTLVSVTNSRSNLKIDPDLSAPKSDTYSVGIDRQLGAQLAFNASYVHKNGSNIIGWRDIGGIYGEGTTVLPDGRTLPIYPILNSPSARVFQRTNRPDYSDSYDGLVASLQKRMSHRWQGQMNLTLGRSEGLRLTGTTAGRDPNDLTNATGRLNPTDRPVMFTANVAYEVPRVDVRISANYQNLSNVPFAPLASVALPQGRRNINIEEPGAFRAERISLLYLRFNKIIGLPAGRKIELIANLVNALQSEAPTGTATTNYVTFNYFSPNFGLPNTWVQPRMLYVGTRVSF